jgi:pilus assembly protein Flp/PilA
VVLALIRTGLYIMIRTKPAARVLSTRATGPSLQYLGGSQLGLPRLGIASGRGSCLQETHITERRNNSMMDLARKFWNDESGQGLAEYALLLGLIVVGVVILIQGMGVSIKNIFGRANSELKSAATPVT